MSNPPSAGTSDRVPYLPLAWRFVLGVAAILALSLGFFYLRMQPPMSDLVLMALFLLATAAISILLAYSAYRMGWMDRSPSVLWTLVGSYALAALLVFINVWITARLMFANQHDLGLATVLLLFSSGIAIAFGYFFSNALSERIRKLEQSAISIARGDLNVRAPVLGRDEIAALSRTFNQMAEQIQAADKKQRELDTLRRSLIAWASHDLQTPLASIQAILEALADGMVDDPQTVERYLKNARREVGALSGLINDLFQLAQIDAGGLQIDRHEDSLADLISDTLESFSELAARQGIVLQGKVSSDLDPVWMDTPRIGRVLNNLLGNAIRYTPYGGEIMVTAERRSGWVIVQVIDSGPGIPWEDLPFVFDSFYKGEKSRGREAGGAGLGLAIARGIVETHGGQIAVENRAGKGTAFTFSLPGRQNL